MTLAEAVVAVFRRYADFEGRSRPAEYWLFTLFVVLVQVGALMIVAISPGSAISGLLGVALLFFGVAALVPSLAVTVRRLHDGDRSGWTILIALVPFIGSLILIVMLAASGTEGVNRFGPDPVDRPRDEPDYGPPPRRTRNSTIPKVPRR